MKAALTAFGFNLRRAIKNRGLKQKDAAERLGISLTYISQLCKGESAPSFEMIVKISDLLDVPIAELFGQSNNREPLNRLIYIASKLQDEMLESLCEVASTLAVTVNKGATAKN